MPQGRKETLEMSGDRARLALLGSPVPVGLLARGVLRAAWVEKAEKGRKVLRGSQVLMGLPGGQAPLGLEGRPGVSDLRVFQGSQAPWVNRASWEPPDRWAPQVPWGRLASRG